MFENVPQMAQFIEKVKVFSLLNIGHSLRSYQSDKETCLITLQAFPVLCSLT